MRTLQDVTDQFDYHPATPEVAATYARIRDIASRAATDAWDLVPDGPEKTLAMRGLQQFLLYSNLAIALTTPADKVTPGVARVLPVDTAAKSDAPPQSGTTRPGYLRAETYPGYRGPASDGHLRYGFGPE